MSHRIGKHFVLCDICGNRFFNDEVAAQWDGTIACIIRNKCWSPKPASYLPLRRPKNEGVVKYPVRPEVSTVANTNGDGLVWGRTYSLVWNDPYDVSNDRKWGQT